MLSLRGFNKIVVLLTLILLIGCGGDESTNPPQEPIVTDPPAVQTVDLTAREQNLAIYWTDARTDKIQRANLDGSNIEDLVTRAQGLDGPSGIALDVAGGKMYWTDSGLGTGKIQRANLDGSNSSIDVRDRLLDRLEDLVTRAQGLRHPFGIALDVAGGKMYWTDQGTHSIRRANFDGSNIEDLVTTRIENLGTTGLRTPSGIALDVAGGKMYWTDYWTDKIQRANLDGSNIEDLVTSAQGLDGPSGIALGILSPIPQ